MRLLLSIISLVVLAQTARADGLMDLAKYLEAQNASKPSPFNSDPPPGLLGLLRNYNDQQKLNAELDTRAVTNSFILEESARRDTMIQMMAPPAPDGYKMSPQAMMIVNSVGAQIQANGARKRFYLDQ